MAMPEYQISSSNNDGDGGASEGMPLGLQLQHQPPPRLSFNASLVEHLRQLNAEAFLLSSSATTATTPSHSWTSDLDTESTGSFFPERSTTLGSLIGLRSPIPASPHNNTSNTATSIDPHVLLEAPQAHTAKKSFSRHRSLWCPFSLISCGSSEPACEDTMSTSLAAFLEMERKTAAATAEPQGNMFNRNTLFNEDGILPPPLSGAPSKLGMEQSTSPSSSYLSADWSTSVAPPHHIHGRERHLVNDHHHHHHHHHHRFQQHYHLRRLSSSPVLSSR